MRSVRTSLLLICLQALAWPAGALLADEFAVQVHGIKGPLKANVEARTETFRISGNVRLSRRRLEELRADTELRARIALRPYGYYQPIVRSELRSTGDRQWILDLHIDRGPPVLISELRLDIVGPGATDPELRQWQAEWPLRENSVLDQTAWEEQKRLAIDRAEAHGYLNAKFIEHVIELDLERNRAQLALVLETGEQAVMGEVLYQQDIVKPGVLDPVPRFSPGQPYNRWLLEQFRLDLWKTGYFSNIEVQEKRRLDQSPPRVDLVLSMQPRKRNTYQGSLGIGSDTGLRLQAVYSRHLLSSRGDSFDVGVGWRQQDNEFSLRSTYRLPRRAKAREFWLAETFYRNEQQNLAVSPIDEPDRLIRVAAGSVTDSSIKPGWLRTHDLRRGQQQLMEHWYLQYVNDNSSLRPIQDAEGELFRAVLTEDPAANSRLSTETWSVGVSWDWPVVRGSGFETVGHHERAWIFTSNTAWGSDIDFTQVYVSGRWNRIFADRWKLLLRGEAGYSDADVFETLVELEDESFSISLSELPHLYRFRAGGAQSVRGYGFERLSSSNIGSNHILTASIELERKVRKNWSVAGFFDIGNAFNDWNERNLRKGVGAGVRWYSIAGAIRVDFAQALDEPGKPWSVHFTIGSPLL
ncbi:MAG: BamA/TamA family outer membrane protein [Xanthomonadales bacterium]|nr:BamA/TamA family outer membrane protein [Xanthomonadales bacterium]